MLLIKGGTVHDGKGRILENTDILINNNLIEDIGNSIEVSENVEVYNAKGKVIFPGFIDSLNVWGAKGPGWGDDDLSELSDPVTPQMDVVYSFDQDNMCFQRVFEYGITSAGLAPSTSNVLGGYMAVFKTYGEHPYRMLVKDKVGQVASISSKTKAIYGKRNTCPMTKMGAVSLLREAIIKAMNYKENHKEYDSKNHALQLIINRKVPLMINCNTKSEMDAIELALKDLSVDIVFTGAFGVDEHTGYILDDKFSVILGDLTGHMSYVNTQVDFEGIKRLMERGVDIAISSCGDNVASGKESLLWNAILCYKNGLDAEDVLRMITSIPAKILGVDDRIGSIEIGKDADIVIWSDNPIKTYSAKVEASFINGQNILHSRRYNTCWS
ncbi:amidohydrolase family protein [Tepidimicrobium xylanilyticum]|uniref:Imidazolonepropionase n=1 Tax=Tepidimicrobium xylanilyticum TaxID=1123352 RepID=A0A1H2Q017_9FIRM|nr:amidohydrolase family protein [Tepidimicrobium xylanilyticum]GMG95794.1 amidohydrolase [Tepidimicrobium xylanilyticum]SDW00462.1 Imidazolonepropionase [Tepidimicrobium xylanilyticum]